VKLVVKDLTSTKFNGADGPFTRIAPLPTADIVDVPTTLVTVTLTLTLLPHKRLYGAELSTIFGIKHVLFATIAG